MNTTDTRIQTSFRLRGSLLAALRKDAERNHRSLNNYVETLLLESVEWVPNAETRRAIYEAENDINLEPFDLEKFRRSIKKSK